MGFTDFPRKMLDRKKKKKIKEKEKEKRPKKNGAPLKRKAATLSVPKKTKKKRLVKLGNQVKVNSNQVFVSATSK